MLLQLCITWKTKGDKFRDPHYNLYMRYAVIMVVVAYLIGGLSYLLYHEYDSEGQFISEIIFYLFVCMGIWQNSINNIYRSNKTQPISMQTLVFWMIPIVTAIAWLIVGE